MFSATNLIAALALSAVSFLAFRHLVRRGLAPERIVEKKSPADLGLGYDEVGIPTENNKTLFGWFVPAHTEGRAPAAIILHGWGSNAELMLPLLVPLHLAGFSVLIFDARCHGRSDDDDFTSLPRFAEDLGCALSWLKRQQTIDPRRIALVGHSVGAGAALLVAARRDDVVAIVSLAAFSHPVSMMRRLLATKRIPFIPMGWAVLRYVQHVIDHRFDDIAPVTTIRKVRCPTLLVHGAEDVTVPVSEARAIYAARSGDYVKLKIVPGSHDDFGDSSDVTGEIAELVTFLLTCGAVTTYH
jgi:pimeloyl-ACP methyl ester carboxylesterase